GRQSFAGNQFAVTGDENIGHFGGAGSRTKANDETSITGFDWLIFGSFAAGESAWRSAVGGDRPDVPAIGIPRICARLIGGIDQRTAVRRKRHVLDIKLAWSK